MMKSHLFLAVVISVFALIMDASACSISINELQMKNVLVSAAANEFDIGLDKATKITVTEFNHELVGNVPGSSCEQYLDIKAHVVIAYSPNFLEKCELSVDVTLRQDLHAESFPFETYIFEVPASSCSRISPVLAKPVKPIRPIRPSL